MYGAIIGDIVGSPYVGDVEDKTKDFKLFRGRCKFTDATVQTVAIADALMVTPTVLGEDTDPEQIKELVITSLQLWGRKYPGVGYGQRFLNWLEQDKPQPYNSYGDASAARVSSVGWLYDSMDKTRAVARITAEITHNHREGIKGAECVAAAIFLARNGATKELIREYIEREFGYDLSRSLADIRPKYRYETTCQETVPEAITAFLEAKSYEDAVRNSVSLGGNTDTVAAITGSVAEAFFGIPDKIREKGKMYLTADILQTLRAFDEVMHRRGIQQAVPLDDTMRRNADISDAIRLSNHAFRENNELLTVHGMPLILDTLRKRIQDGGALLMGFGVMPTYPARVAEMGRRALLKNNMFLSDVDVTILPCGVVDRDQGTYWLALFTSKAEMNDWTDAQFAIEIPIETAIRMTLSLNGVDGLVINPFNESAELGLEELAELVPDVEKSAANE